VIDIDGYTYVRRSDPLAKAKASATVKRQGRLPPKNRVQWIQQERDAAFGSIGGHSGHSICKNRLCLDLALRTEFRSASDDGQHRCNKARGHFDVCVRLVPKAFGPLAALEIV